MLGGAGASKRAKLALVEVIPHSDLAHEDLPARQALDVQMLVVVDGKERSRVRYTLPRCMTDVMCATLPVTRVCGSATVHRLCPGQHTR
jgi:hypothetical protein